MTGIGGGIEANNVKVMGIDGDRQTGIGRNQQTGIGRVEVVKPCPAPDQASRPSVGSDSRPVPSRHAVSCDMVFKKTLANIKAPQWLH